MKNKSTRGISRMNYASSSNGWLVRYTREGVTFNKLFSDGVFGSEEASREAAENYYNDLITAFPPPTWEEFLANGNTPESGIYGVSLRKNKRSYSWEARWKLNGKEVKRRFGVETHGNEEAKRMAIEARKAIEPELEREYYEKYWNYRTGARFNKASIVEDPFAFEGAEKFVLHKAAERDKTIRLLKLRAFLKEHGTLFCEICHFNFEKVYGQLGKGLIEVHHLVPIAKMEENHKTTLDELMCICSNCHFAIHNGDADDNLRLMKRIFEPGTRK